MASGIVKNYISDTETEKKINLIVKTTGHSRSKIIREAIKGLK